MRSTLQCKGEIIIFILQYAYLKCTYIGIAKLCCNYISTDPLDYCWILNEYYKYIESLNGCMKTMNIDYPVLRI